MSKNLRKLVSVLVMLVLTLSLGACGNESAKEKNEKKSSVKKLSTEDLFEKYSEAAKNIKGMTFKLNLGANLSANGQEIKLKCNADIMSKLEEPAMHMKLDVNVDVSGETQATTIELYEMAGDSSEKLDAYMNMMGSWVYSETDLSQYGDYEALKNSLGSLAENIDFLTVKEYFDYVEAQAVDDNYEVTLIANTKSMLEKLKASEYANYIQNIDISNVPDTTITITITIDGQTCLAKKLSIDMDLESMNVQGVAFKVSDFVLEADYISYDEPEIQLPNEAIEAKENGKTSFSLFD